jgi:hypothetical protein
MGDFVMLSSDGILGALCLVKQFSDHLAHVACEIMDRWVCVSQDACSRHAAHSFTPLSITPTIAMMQASLDPKLDPASHMKYRFILESALKTYEEKTEKDLASDPLLHRLEACHSSDDIITILGQQILGIDHVQNRDDGMMRWLKPTVDVIHSFSVVMMNGTDNRVSSTEYKATYL